MPKTPRPANLPYLITIDHWWAPYSFGINRLDEEGEPFREYKTIELQGVLIVPTQPSDNLFRARYALTPAEAALVSALAHGQSLAGYAEAKGLSVFTVRAQLKAVFAKTNVHRQGELVALFMRSAAPGKP